MKPALTTLTTLATLTILAAPMALADTEYWEYKDWQVAVETVDTGEDLRVTCSAWTGGDGDPTFKIEVSNGDALPPDYYPQPFLHESAIRGYHTMMKEGSWVLFESDTGWSTEGYATAWLEMDVFENASVQPSDADGLGILQEMRKAGRMFVTQDGDIVYEASLSGFTAAYGKIAEQCGFPTTGVID